MLGISGVSSDMRDLISAIESGNKRAKLALDMFEYRAIKLIGSFVAALNGADILVFTGGIGENSDPVRKDICDGLSYLGIKIDEKINKTVHGKEQIISTPDSKIQVIVIPTDEELTIASDTEEIVSK